MDGLVGQTSMKPNKKLCVIISCILFLICIPLVSATLIPEPCTLLVGLHCSEYEVTNDYISLTIENGMGRSVYVDNMNVTETSTPPQITCRFDAFSFEKGEEIRVTSDRCDLTTSLNLEEKNYKFDIKFVYRFNEEYSHKGNGELFVRSLKSIKTIRKREMMSMIWSVLFYLWLFLPLLILLLYFGRKRHPVLETVYSGLLGKILLTLLFLGMTLMLIEYVYWAIGGVVDAIPFILVNMVVLIGAYILGKVITGTKKGGWVAIAITTPYAYLWLFLFG